MNALDVPSVNAAALEVDEMSLPARSVARITGVVTGTLLALIPDGMTALVAYPGQPATAAMTARITTDLHGGHIGSDVVLMFDGGDPRRPIVIGRVRGTNDRSPSPETARVDVEADGERMIVTAKDQLVLRCGKASITLTKAGKILISGTYLLSHSSGANRIKGGSIQLN